MIKVWRINNLQEEFISKMTLPIRILSLIISLIWLLNLNTTAQCEFNIEVFSYNGTECVNETLGVITDANSPTYQWFRNDTLLPGETNDYLLINALGVFRIEVTDLTDCTESSGAFSITLMPPQVAIYGDTIFCEGFTAQLVAVPDGGSGVEYWFDENSNVLGESQNTVFVSLPGFYHVVTMDINTGCYGLDTTSVSEIPNTLGIPEVYQITDTIYTDSASYYQWYLVFNPIPGANDQFILITGDGIYQVEIGDNSGYIQMSDSYVIGERIFTFPDDIIFQSCSEPFSSDFTGVITISFK